MVTVGKANIPIVDHERVGVSLSGGADSAVLLYILMSNINPSQQLFLYTFGQRPTNFFNIYASRMVLKCCVELTGFTNYEHRIDFDDDQDVPRLFKAPSDDILSNNIDFLYTGWTANPPRDVADNLTNAEDNHLHHLRDPEVHRDIMFKEQICTPFTNINKQDIADIYSELNLMDNLYPFTRSCEHPSPKYLGTHCGQCWWCKEREWGFGYL